MGRVQCFILWFVQCILNRWCVKWIVELRYLGIRKQCAVFMVILMLLMNQRLLVNMMLMQVAIDVSVVLFIKIITLNGVNRI